MTKEEYGKLKTVARFLMHAGEANDYDDEFNRGANWAGNVLLDALSELYKEQQTAVLLKPPRGLDLCS